MNDVSFVAPRRNSILEAAYFDQVGVFTSDFPPSPAMKFNHTVKGTKIYKIKYGSVVQVVLQGSSLLLEEEHPIHLHGYDFYVMGRGIGEFVMERDGGELNMVDPPKRNTVGIPAGGWTVIRFVANNPGVWLMHCHMEIHHEWGMAMVFWVEDGVGKMESVRPPPTDLPPC
ncbi:laccase-3-like [Phalaenopsis equestris]|nr:laccase-3-like [Phalaenopsis equestris]